MARHDTLDDMERRPEGHLPWNVRKGDNRLPETKGPALGGGQEAPPALVPPPLRNPRTARRKAKLIAGRLARAWAHGETEGWISDKARMPKMFETDRNAAGFEVSEDGENFIVLVYRKLGEPAGGTPSFVLVCGVPVITEVNPPRPVDQPLVGRI